MNTWMRQFGFGEKLVSICQVKALVYTQVLNGKCVPVNPNGHVVKPFR